MLEKIVEIVNNGQRVFIFDDHANTGIKICNIIDKICNYPYAETDSDRQDLVKQFRTFMREGKIQFVIANLLSITQIPDQVIHPNALSTKTMDYITFLSFNTSDVVRGLTDPGYPYSKITREDLFKLGNHLSNLYQQLIIDI